MSAARSLAGYRAAETRSERDEFAAANIPDALIPLWNRTKLNFRGTPEARAEKFLQYAHDHEDEGMEAVVDTADRKLDAMIREHEARERSLARRSRSGGFASPSALVIGLGLAALGYVIYRATRKKSVPPVAHHAGAPVPPVWPMPPVEMPYQYQPYPYPYEWERAY